MRKLRDKGAGWVRYRTTSGVESIDITNADSEKWPETAPGLINLNTATADELVELDGVDDDTAMRIIQHRPFESVDELTRVGGIGPARLEANRDRITV